MHMGFSLHNPMPPLVNATNIISNIHIATPIAAIDNWIRWITSPSQRNLYLRFSYIYLFWMFCGVLGCSFRRLAIASDAFSSAKSSTCE